MSVSNHGPTIPPATLARLFEPFVQGDGESVSDGERKRGLGLGLFIVSQIASVHGGAVSVVSEGGRVMFTLDMPRLAEAD